MYTRKAYATREAPKRGQINDQPEAREGRAGRLGVAERFVVPLKPGNSGGGKGPQFKTDAIRGEGPGVGKAINSDKGTEAADGVGRESVKSCPRAGCGKSACPVRCARCGNGAMVEPLRHRQTKGAATDMFYLMPPRHISTYMSAKLSRPFRTAS